MKKILFISTIFPYPTDNGKKVVIAGILDYLNDILGMENIYFVILSKQSELKKERLNVIELDKPKAYEQMINLLYFSVLTRKKSIQEAMLYSSENKKKLDQIIAEVKPNIVVYDTIRAAQYFEEEKSDSVNHVLYMDDLFSIRYARMLGVIKEFPKIELNPLGNFHNNVPSILKNILVQPIIQRIALTYEKELIKKREKEIVKWFNKNLLINSGEANYLRNISGVESILPVKPLLKERMNNSRDYHGSPVFVFMGDLKVPHNQISIKKFIVSQIDNIMSLIPNVKIRIIGKNADQEIINLSKKYSDTLLVEGYVEDISKIFNQSCAMLIPLLFGSGVKIKTIEALAYGMPVITTDYGIEGIDGTDKKDYLIENDFNEYPRLMKELCSLSYNEYISKNAKEFYLSNYSKEVIYKEYKDIFIQ